MTSTATPVTPRTRPTLSRESTAGQIRFDILYPGGDHESARLDGAKITLGSAAGCHLRLRGSGVLPVHGLILRGPAGTFVRGWSGCIELNGAAVDHAELRSGDQLRIGDATLIYRDAPAPTTPAPRRRRSVRANPSNDRRSVSSATNRIARLRRTKDRLRRRIDRLTERRREERLRWRQDRARMQAELSGQQELHALLEAKSIAWREALERQHSTLRQEFQDWRNRDHENEAARIAGQHLEQLRTDFASEKAAWESSMRTREAQWRTRRAAKLRSQRRSFQDLRRQLAELAQKSLDLESRESRWNAEYLEQSSRLGRQQEELRNEREALAQERALVTLESSTLEAELQAQLVAREHECLDLQNRLADLDRELNEARHQLLASQSQAENMDGELRRWHEGYATLENQFAKEQSDLCSLRTEFERIEAERQVANQNLAAATIALEESRRRIEELEAIAAQVEAITAQADASDAQWLANTQHQARQFDQERQAWEAERARWSAEREGWEKRLADLRSEQATIHGIHDDWNTERDQWLEREQSWLTERQDWEARFSQIRGELAAQQEVQAALDSERRNQQARDSAWDQERSAWLAEREELSAQQAKASDERAAFETERVEFRSERDQWAQRAAAWEAERNAWQARDNELAATIAELRLEITSLQTALRDAEETRSQRDSESQMKSDSLTRLETELRDQSASVARLEAELVATKAAGEESLALYESSREEFARLHAQWTEAAAAMEAASAQPHEELHAEFAAQLDALGQQMSTERQTWQAHVMALEQQLQALHDAGANWDSERAAMSREHSLQLARSQEELQALRTQLETLQSLNSATPPLSAPEDPQDCSDESADSTRELLASLLGQPSEPTEVPNGFDDETSDLLAKYGFTTSASGTEHRSDHPPHQGFAPIDEAEKIASAYDDSEEMDSPLEAAARLGYREAAAEDQVANHAANECQETPDDNTSDGFDSETGGGGEDEAITDYMQRLLQRVGSKHSGQAAMGEEPPRRLVAKPETKPRIVLPVQDADGEESLEGSVPLTPQSLPPKRTKPDVVANLDAMRALANASTRSAIQTHQVVKHKSRIMLNLGLTSIVLLLATTAMVLGRVKMRMLFYLGAASIPFAIIFGVQTVISVLKANRLRHPPRPTPDEADDESERTGGEDFMGAMRA